MFAYCRNNPVSRIDISGTLDIDSSEENNELLNKDITDWTGSGDLNSQSHNVPEQAGKTLRFIKSHNGHPPQNQKGGKPYANDGRDGSQILPSNGGIYREYDVYPKIPGADRGDERIVIGSNGPAWYTMDHYKSFTRME